MFQQSLKKQNNKWPNEKPKISEELKTNFDKIYFNNAKKNNFKRKLNKPKTKNKIYLKKKACMKNIESKIGKNSKSMKPDYEKLKEKSKWRPK